MRQLVNVLKTAGITWRMWRDFEFLKSYLRGDEKLRDAKDEG